MCIYNNLQCLSFHSIQYPHNKYIDLINSISNAYYDQDWGNDQVNSISVHIAEIELIHDWTDERYQSLAPRFMTDCTDYFNNDQCSIHGSEWVKTTRSWINNYKDTSTFDNTMIIHRMKLWDSSGKDDNVVGWGTLRTM